jgi:hypothetical protein
MKIPDCPKCGKAVDDIEVEDNEAGLSLFEQARTILPPADMWLVPCMHRISGYRISNVSGDVLEIRL